MVLFLSLLVPGESALCNSGLDLRISSSYCKASNLLITFPGCLTFYSTFHRREKHLRFQVVGTR